MLEASVSISSASKRKRLLYCLRQVIAEKRVFFTIKLDYFLCLAVMQPLAFYCMLILRKCFFKYQQLLKNPDHQQREQMSQKEKSEGNDTSKAVASGRSKQQVSSSRDSGR
jgi:flagellar biosynthesis component FlhA